MEPLSLSLRTRRARAHKVFCEQGQAETHGGVTRDWRLDLRASAGFLVSKRSLKPGPEKRPRCIVPTFQVFYLDIFRPFLSGFFLASTLWDFLKRRLRQRLKKFPVTDAEHHVLTLAT
jgi:hypothetical protein